MIQTQSLQSAQYQRVQTQEVVQTPATDLTAATRSKFVPRKTACRLSVRACCRCLWRSDSPLPSAPRFAVATHRRAATLKLYLPRYLTVPIVREVIVCNDFNSPDYDDLLAWLPGSGLSPEDQARMRLVGDTGARLGGFRNKVRCLGLARFAWAAILDSDNFASPEHYWAPLASHWKSVYGAAPPPPGTRDAERRAFNPGLWMQASVPLGPTEMTGSNWAVSIARMCSPEGEKIAAPQEGAPLDARAAVGRGCWTAAWQGEGIFVSRRQSGLVRAMCCNPSSHHSLSFSSFRPAAQHVQPRRPPPDFLPRVQ